MKAFQSNIRFLPMAIIFLFVACGIVKKSPTSGRHIIGVETQYGIMKIRLYDATPVHRDNMIKLVEQGYYNGTTFFRVIKNFMMQGGSSDTRNAPAGVALGENDTLKYTLQSEIQNGIYHKKGALAQAREDNPEKRSHGGEFYIVQGKVYLPDSLEAYSVRRKFTLNDDQRKIYTTVGGTPHLDGNYTVYGEVIQGLNIIDSICNVPTTKEINDRPLKDIVMKVWMIK